MSTRESNATSDAVREGWDAMLKVASSALRVPAEVCKSAADAMDKAREDTADDHAPPPSTDLGALNERIDELERELKVLKNKVAEIGR